MSGTLKDMDFEQVYNKYYSSIYLYIFKRIKRAAEAEDLSNEVFYACLKSFDKYDSSKSSIVTWLFVITNNKLKNYYRDRKIAVSLNDDDNPIELPYDEDFDSAIYVTDIRKVLHLGLSSLPERERTIIILKYFHHLKSEEIASRLNLSAVNVRVILNRSLNKIKDYLNKNDINWEF